MEKAKAAKKVSAVLEEIFGGKVADLTAAQFAERIPQLEAKAAAAAERCIGLEGEIRAEAVDAIGGADGMARLVNLREKLKPGQEERDLLTFALEGARTLLARKRRAEWESAIGTARQDVERLLATRQAVADRIDERVRGLAADLQELQQLGGELMHAARAKLSDVNVVGFRATGNTGQGFMAFTAQHEVNLHLGFIGGLAWIYDQMPPLMRGCPGFAGYTANWHAQFLNDFEERFSRDHPEVPAVAATDDVDAA